MRSIFGIYNWYRISICNLYHSCVLNKTSLSFSALSLQCFHCSYNNFASSNPVLNFFIQIMKKLKDNHCKHPVGTSALELTVRRCPPARAGYVYKCGVINGTVHAAILGGECKAFFCEITRARSAAMREYVTHVTSSLIGADLAHVIWDNTQKNMAEWLELGWEVCVCVCEC